MFYEINQFAVLTMLAIASYEDIKTREVRLITQAMLFFQCALWAVYAGVQECRRAESLAILNSSTLAVYLLSAVLPSVLMLGWGYFLYKHAGIGGADGKVMACLALVKPHYAFLIGACVMFAAVTIMLFKKRGTIQKRTTVPFVPIITGCYIGILIIDILSYTYG